MAKKRQISKLDEPPIPASKDKQKPPPQEENEEEEDGSTSSQAASSSEQVEEDEEDNQQTPSKSASKNPPTPSSISQPKPSSSEETDAESESESDPEPNPKLKPLPSKPIKSKAQAQTQSSPPPTKSGTKRPADNGPKQSNKKKKTTVDDDVKEPVEDDAKKTGDDSKKYFQRLFSEDDELIILKSLVDFTAKTGNDPYKYITAFYEFVKKLIHVKVTLEQLKYKIRRLKQKFENKVKSGKPPSSDKPIEKQTFELGLKIWGDKVKVFEGEEKGKPNGKSLKKEPAAKKPTTTKKLVMEPDSPLVDLNESRKVESTDKIVDSGASLILNEMVRFDRSVGFSGLNMDVIKNGVVSLDESQRDEFEGRWKKLHIAELELFTRRAELVEEQTSLILDALRSSSSR